MRTIVLAKDLVPVAEFRAEMAEWLIRLQKAGRPVVLTQRGRAAAVLVRPEMLDDLEAERALVPVVLGRLREIAAGDLVDDDTVWRKVDAVIRRARRTHQARKERKKRADPVD